MCLPGRTVREHYYITVVTSTPKITVGHVMALGRVLQYLYPGNVDIQYGCIHLSVNVQYLTGFKCTL